MDEVMKQISVQYDEEVQDQLDSLVAKVEPTLVAILSIAVGMIPVSYTHLRLLFILHTPFCSCHVKTKFLSCNLFRIQICYNLSLIHNHNTIA